VIDKRLCQEGGEGCGLGVRPDPRFPKLDDGYCVLCEVCFEAACEEIRANIEHDLECLNDHFCSVPRNCWTCNQHR
jgi:hypothetical protein